MLVYSVETSKMSHHRQSIPSSPSSTSLGNSSSAVSRGVVAVVPATSKIFSSFKPFLLGFVTALMVIALAMLSSVTVLCKDYKPMQMGLATTGPSAPPTSYCSSNTTINRKETEKNKELRRDNGRLKWHEKIPFLKSFASKLKKRRPAQRIKKAGNTNPNEILPSMPQDSRDCFCGLVWESFGFRMDQKDSYSFKEVGNDETSSLSLERQQQLQVLEQFPTAFTPEIQNLTPRQEALLIRMGNDVLESVFDFERRSSLVPWGGSSEVVTPGSFDWYARTTKHRDVSTPLDQINGGNLFSSYLRIMKWPENLGPTEFPFKLCKERKKKTGRNCDASVAIRHTLEFRERYMPWLVTPGIKRANARGLVYHRNFSPAHPENKNGHAIVWLRLALKNKTENENERIYFVRSMIREFDRAVAASLIRSNGRLGKFNAVVDGTGFTWNSMPSISSVKALVAILQDHFADRLGVIILVNVGSICELLLKIFLPLITEEVRNKIIMVPQDKTEKMETLEKLLGEKNNIPIWLGGTDDYDFQVDEYYSNDNMGGDEEALKYLTTMPYHA